jgi:homeodomain-containing protein
VWRWQERFMREGLGGLLRDKTRPPGRKPLDPAAVIEHVVALTAEDPPGETTHWTSPSLLAGLLFGTPTATA